MQGKRERSLPVLPYNLHAAPWLEGDPRLGPHPGLPDSAPWLEGDPRLGPHPGLPEPSESAASMASDWFHPPRVTRSQQKTGAAAPWALPAFEPVAASASASASANASAHAHAHAHAHAQAPYTWSNPAVRTGRSHHIERKINPLLVPHLEGDPGIDEHPAFVKSSPDPVISRGGKRRMVRRYLLKTFR